MPWCGNLSAEMNAFTFAGLRPMTEGDLEQVLFWRNHPDIRRYMYSQHEISLEEHVGWFARASQDLGRHLLIFEINGTPWGFLQLAQIASGGIADWGFYVAPDAPEGVGRALGEAALRYAFETLGLHKICGQALAFNERSIHFHLALRFEREGQLRQQHFDGEQYHDVVYFGRLASEWPPLE
jgi:UDP-4-amino-4,6-dideoxy-N-acetyl-beta-L-altrosamine N-acetyltransferase